MAISCGLIDDQTYESKGRDEQDGDIEGAEAVFRTVCAAGQRRI
jgi:hypothetical protein